MSQSKEEGGDPKRAKTKAFDFVSAYEELKGRKPSSGSEGISPNGRFIGRLAPNSDDEDVVVVLPSTDRKDRYASSSKPSQKSQAKSTETPVFDSLPKDKQEGVRAAVDIVLKTVTQTMLDMSVKKVGDDWIVKTSGAAGSQGPAGSKNIAGSQGRAVGKGQLPVTSQHKESPQVTVLSDESKALLKKWSNYHGKNGADGVLHDHKLQIFGVKTQFLLFLAGEECYQHVNSRERGPKGELNGWIQFPDFMRLSRRKIREQHFIGYVLPVDSECEHAPKAEKLYREDVDFILRNPAFWDRCVHVITQILDAMGIEMYGTSFHFICQIRTDHGWTIETTRNVLETRSSCCRITRIIRFFKIFSPVHAANLLNLLVWRMKFKSDDDAGKHPNNMRFLVISDETYRFWEGALNDDVKLTYKED